MIHTHPCAYPRVSNVSFSENFAYILNKWSLVERCPLIFLFTPDTPDVHFSPGMSEVYFKWINFSASLISRMTNFSKFREHYVSHVIHI